MFWLLVCGSIYQLLRIRDWVHTMGISYSLEAFLLSIYIWNNYGIIYYYYYCYSV
jgi:hypothetical protein